VKKKDGNDCLLGTTIFPTLLHCQGSPKALCSLFASCCGVVDVLVLREYVSHSDGETMTQHDGDALLDVSSDTDPCRNRPKHKMAMVYLRGMAWRAAAETRHRHCS
jgi:hypothetical protein